MVSLPFVKFIQAPRGSRLKCILFPNTCYLWIVRLGQIAVCYRIDKKRNVCRRIRFFFQDMILYLSNISERVFQCLPVLRGIKECLYLQTIKNIINFCSCLTRNTKVKH